MGNAMSSTGLAKLLRSAPYFPVSDVARSTAYYLDVLGFQAEYAGGSEFAIVVRDGLPMMLRRVSNEDLIVPSEKQGGTWDAFFWVSRVKDLYAELVSRGAVIVYGPLVQAEYQMLEFAVRDCDGHVLGFGESLADEQT
jgi:catechol 2,3-dioxygenase-like lactoylglutathione lyase family enzyme